MKADLVEPLNRRCNVLLTYAGVVLVSILTVYILLRDRKAARIERSYLRMKTRSLDRW